MADDAGWHSGLETALPVGAASWSTRERFQDVLSEFARRLASPEPMRRETAVALVQQLDRLGGRLAAEQETAIARAIELDAALVALTARLEAASAAGAAREAELATRIDGLVAELTEARNARRPVPVRTILAAVAACTALGGAAAGIVGMTRQPPESDAAPPPQLVVVAKPIEAPLTPVPAPVVNEMASAAAVVGPPAAPSPAVPTTKAATARDTFSSVADALRRRDPGAVVRLTALALTGDAKAQLRLALLHEAGDHGLPRDLGAARLWTLRAAAGGDREAMYNAGQLLMDGVGGPKDPGLAATWFRRAAERGVVDAQYNLGLMYETGHGVDRDPLEAAKWYGMAGKAGDATARQKQADLVASADDAPAPDAGVRGASVSETQTYLSQKGYYIGPIDGVVTSQLRAAADAYMKDHPGIVPSR